jgi:hypothetical protein
VEGAIAPHSRRSKAAQKTKQSGGGRRERQRRPLRLLGDGRDGEMEGGGVSDADGYPQYRPPEVIDDEADDPYEPGFISTPIAARSNGGGDGMSSFGGSRGVSPSRGSRVVGKGGGINGGGSPRLAIVDRYGDSGVSGGRR